MVEPLTEHTPGPWIADGGYRVRGNSDGHRYDIARMCLPPHHPDAIAAANARLIAAAPKLVARLYDWLCWHANHFEEFSDEINRQLACLSAETEVAIAKAAPQAAVEPEQVRP